MTYTDDARVILRTIRRARDELDKPVMNLPTLKRTVSLLSSQISKVQSRFTSQIAPLLKSIGSGPNISRGIFGAKLSKMPRISEMDAKLAELQARAGQGNQARKAKQAAKNANNRAKKAANASKSNAAARNALKKQLNALENKVGRPNGAAGRNNGTNVAKARASLRSRFNALTANQRAKALTSPNVTNAFNQMKPNSNFNNKRLSHIANVIRNATSRNSLNNFTAELRR